MNKYRIDAFKLDSYVKRKNNQALKAIVLSIISQYIIFSLILSLDETLHNIMSITIVAMVLMTIIFGYGYIAYSKITYQLARRLELVTDDFSITQRVRIDDPQEEKNIFTSMFYDLHNTVVSFENISLIERKNNDLHIRLSVHLKKRRKLIIP